MIEQAQKQIKAANGMKIEWHFDELKALEATKKLLEDAEITGIDLVFDPMD